MRMKRLLIGFRMTLRMLFRRRIVAILLVLIPLVFLSVVEWTTSDRDLPFKLASLDKDAFITVSERGISLVFFAVASTGFLLSFLGLHLIQHNREVNKRLILCGMSPVELLFSTLMTMLLLMLVIGLYIAILTNWFFTTDHFYGVWLGLVTIGFVYGCYGLLVGSLIKGELEGILMIVLLVNIDAGWLQNPLFYDQAENQEIIQLLPAYFPSQLTVISAFSDHPIQNALEGSLYYGLCLLALAIYIFYAKMKIAK